MQLEMADFTTLLPPPGELDKMFHLWFWPIRSIM